MDIQDTIAAVATPIGIGGIGIIKISGSLSSQVAEKIFRKRKNSKASRLRPYHLHLGEIVNPSTQEIVDEVLLTYMPAPASYTREDVVEIHCHSGYLILEKILDLVLSHEGIRLAEQGEFTRRAFLNGRIDLTQVEAIVDLINARSSIALRQATCQLKGTLSEKVFNFKERLITLVSNLEASIDFPEEDIEVYSSEEILTKLKALKEELIELVSTYQEGKFFREGIKVTIIGRPNVGKSSLLNALLEEERAIVSHLPGTTRDTIEENATIYGIPITFVDTAGIPLYPITNPIEKKGVTLTRTKAFQADVVLFVLDSSALFSENDMAIFQEFRGKRMIVVLNKADLPSKLDLFSLPPDLQDYQTVSLSAKYHQGIDGLKRGIRDVIFTGDDLLHPPVFINRLRHKMSFEKAIESISQAMRTLEQGMSVEFVSLDLTLSLGYLGEVAGETTTEEILDHIFSEFCIGK